ncbi:serine hydrolase domain-containing protein [Tunicatimonas pelagia]|uniref:serine hydrolase domain-containing protein n=1 Tax=Tunicatimonas pelagia TaxID=931531 RepID=UPI002666EE53|nr:serine hydrolase domain-containing protein [Tunicatimonas pelagia]WKN40758.1 serine hydrolase [Tunicatimonas pelagia]
MRVINIILATFLVVYSACSQNQPNAKFNRVKMDSLFAKIDTEKQGMGSVSISKNGEQVYQRAFGYADVAERIPANATTIYRIGSISKTFTSSIIMQLIEEGKLALDTKLSEYFPEVPNADKITIEQMLRHRSGLFNFTSAKDYTKWMEEPKSRDELIQEMIDNGTVFEPGEKAEYSNTNYVLLSYVAEKIDDKDFADILQDRITKPLKLEHTYYGGKINPEENEARSYTLRDDWEIATETDMSLPAGAGAIVSNPTDLTTFFNALFTGKVVSEKSLKEMTKLIDNFGLGLFQIPFYDQRAFGHNGGIDGFQANVGYFPNDSVAVAYTTNGVGMVMNDILIGVLSIYYGRDYDLPDFKPALKLSNKQLKAYLGVYSSPTFPLKVTITKEGSTLMGQATGQPTFALKAYDTHKFKFDPAQLKLEFMPDEDKMVLQQGGGEFEFSRE